MGLFHARGQARLHATLGAALAMSLVLPGRVSVAAVACVGDCNGGASVTVDEVITMVTIALASLPVTCEAGDVNRDGQITIDEILAAVTNALSGCPAILRLGSASGAPGSRVSIAATLGTPGRVVIAAANDISFDPDAPIAATSGIPPIPECTPNAQLKKMLTRFAFQPPGCTGSQCTGVRALVAGLTPDTVDAPIPDGSTLYTCNVAISPQATIGPKLLKCSNAFYSDPQPMEYPADCTDGEIVVGGP